MDFCNDINFRTQIANIQNILFCANPNVVLNWYATFIKNRKSMPRTIPSTTVPTWNIDYPITGSSTPPGLPPLSGLLPLLSYPFLGYDLPVWL